MSSRFSLTMAAALVSSRPRSRPDRRAQAGWAALALATAVSTSSAAERVTRLSSRPVLRNTGY